MIDNLSFIERVIILVLQLGCFCGLFRCAFGLCTVAKGFDVIVKRLDARIRLYEGKKSNENS